MTHTPDIKRPDRRLVEALREIGTATISGELRNFGIRNAAITGPRALTTGKISAGPALTLQFMPMREDHSARQSMTTRRSSSTAMCCTTRNKATWSSSMRAATWTAASSAR